MNTIIMNQDVLKSAISRRDNRSELPLSSRLNEIVHTPAFIKADASNKTDNDKQQRGFCYPSVINHELPDVS